MERSLLVGDFLFVSKVNYGPRLPETPISFPFAHNTMPLIGTKSYSDIIKLPYYRFPGFSDIKKGDVVVFNYPMDADSPLYRPVDKCENYIKRCQGTPGDTLSVVQGQVYTSTAKPRQILRVSKCWITLFCNHERNGVEPRRVLKDELEISDYGNGAMTMTKDAAATLKGYTNVKIDSMPNVKPSKGDDLQRATRCSRRTPHYPAYRELSLISCMITNGTWIISGPLLYPKEAGPLNLDSLTFPIYARAIEVYESNKVDS